jgi:hypothetical protein
MVEKLFYGTQEKSVNAIVSAAYDHCYRNILSLDEYMLKVAQIVQRIQHDSIHLQRELHGENK